MSKIKKADLRQLIQEQADMMVELSGMVKMNKLSIIKLENDGEQRFDKLEKFASYADNMLTELNHALPDPEYDAKCEAAAAGVEVSLDRHRERLGLNKPQLKQLDQSVFDGLDERWQWATVSSIGMPFVYSYKPAGNKARFSDSTTQEMISAGKVMRVDEYDYDASNWQNSLIEREKELTGSDLCKAMLLDIKKPVMCKTSKGFDLIKSFRTDGDKYLFHGEQQGEYSVVTPVNSQGEPLTAADVGL